MASAAAATTEKGSPVVVGLLVVGNIIILLHPCSWKGTSLSLLLLYQEGSRGSEWGRRLLTETLAGEPTAPAQPLLTGCSVQLSGLALFAETVWVTADQYRVYPLMGVSGKDDVFAGAWIAIFCGFSFFVVASFGVGAALCRRRSMILTMVSNPSLITKQMLTFYSANSDQGRELTRLWDRIMIEQECCGTSGPMDWVNFTSAFRATTPEVVFPWPPLCCRRTGNFIPVNEEGCRLGHLDYLFTKGCFEHIGHAIDSYTWGISWFGFAILMWTLPVMLIAMYFYTTL
ncbi:UPK1A [Cervus elaphus hippelaphus]|uniref:Uroplakin-1a n=1 Tax=Cervus elaphus hippelaphus TaxID=46360 RepID=A0A212DD40_CEREH|nr:UPK1A [Cervus elaphus hippelaphus]